MKRQRTFAIQIFTPSRSLITIEPPFTIECSITRNTLASTNSISLTIYNLAPKTRARIYKDRYALAEYWQMIVWAGYSNLSKVFQGNIYEAMSFKEGTDWITQIEGFDGLSAVQNGFTSRTVGADVPRQNIMRDVITDMPNVIAGIFGAPSQGDSPRGQVLLGNSAQVLGELSEGQYFIDNEIVNIVDSEELIGGDVVLLDQDQLLGTPRRRETFIDVEVLFLPEVQIGHAAEIRSQERIYNGQYKIMGFKHSLQISESVSGSATTSLNLYAGAAGLRRVQ